MNAIFQLNKNDLSQTRVANTGSSPDLAEGQVLLEIENFSFTANNVTYAVMGDRMQYWQFFPAEDGYGVIPVWGFAKVTASKCEGVNVGERFYGYLPMANSVIVEPVRSNPTGFTDGAAHRAKLPIIYNQYLRTTVDALYRPETEAMQMLLRPLFTTSFLLDDFLEDNAFFGANAVTLTSASSKTAYGMAFLLKQNRDRRDHNYQIIGLTSPSNVAFVESLGCYDVVIPYDKLDQLDASLKVVNVDFAGNGTVLGNLHSHLADNLKYSCLVGASHWDQRGGLPKDLAGPEPILFFAPSQAEKRLKEWGGAGFQQRLGDVWHNFVTFADNHINVAHHNGPTAVAAAYQKVLSGEAKPDEGYILSMFEE